MDFLFFTIFVLVLVLSLAHLLGGSGSSGGMRAGRRINSPREEMLHDQIQQAMNWSPDHFHECADGKWRNAYGKEAISLSLEDLMAKRAFDLEKRNK